MASRIPLPSSDAVGGDSRVRGVVVVPPVMARCSQAFPVRSVPSELRRHPLPKFSEELLRSAPTSSSSAQHWGFAGGGGRGRGWGGERLHHEQPPPMGLAARGLTGGGHPAFPQRPLYPTLQTLSPVLTPGSSGVPSHGLTGFPFLAPAQAGKSWPLGPGTARTPPPTICRHTPPPSSCSFLASCSAEFGAGETPLPPGFLQPGPPAWQHPRDMAALG